MSEPLTAREIEDVLSSIRRLVADDLRPAPSGDPAAPPDAKVPPLWLGEKPSRPGHVADQGVSTPPLGKLILTPALRVAPATARPAAQSPPDADGRARSRSTRPEAGRDAAFDDTDDWSGTGWGRPDALARTAPNALRFFHRGHTGAQGQAAVATDGAAGPDVPPLRGDASGAGRAAPSGDPSASGRASAATGDGADTVWGGQAEAGVMDDLAQAIEGRITPAIPLTQAGTALDEVMVRNMVRALIREELAGALGERITRNVRKLVRAEIARALTLQDMD